MELPWKEMPWMKIFLPIFNWVVSPKLSNSYQKINPEAIQFFAERRWGIFKFIAKNHSDLKEIHTFVDEFYIDPRLVYVGMEGTSISSQMNTALVEEIIKEGFNFSPRLHILFWQDERGK
jgi:organic radical activating enzyme